jgi:putative membrane protein
VSGYLYTWAKALHLIGAISWMAGLFYLVRIMVYHAETQQQSPSEQKVLRQQYDTMLPRAYRIIVRPAALITWSFGTTMLCLQPVWWSQSWLITKLLFLITLSLYTHYAKQHIHTLSINPNAFPHRFYRALNEIPTVLMTGIVFLAVFKNEINWIFFALGLLLFSFLIAYGIKKANPRT